MSGANEVTKELSIGELLSQTFDSFRQNFFKYFIVYLIVEAIVGVIGTVVALSIKVPALSLTETASQLTGYLSAYVSLEIATAVAGWIIGSIATATAIKLASDRIQGKETSVQSSFMFTVSKLVWIWVLDLVVGVLTVLGFIALIVPGIILVIMFSVALPVLLIEGPGIFESMSRSRQLVGNRWLKTFGFLIVLGIVIGILSLIGGAIASVFGSGSTLAGDLISAFYAPLYPIGITVFYYSNLARLAPPAPSQTITQTMPAQASPFQSSMKFCPSCGNQLSSGAMFCSKCGAKQPA